MSVVVVWRFEYRDLLLKVELVRFTRNLGFRLPLLFKRYFLRIRPIQLINLTVNYLDIDESTFKPCLNSHLLFLLPF